MSSVVSLLDQDMYSMGQADRLLGLSHGTARRWIDGYERQGKRHDPLVRAESTGSEDVTWGEFVEARLISEYRRQGITIFKMRPAIMALKDKFNTEYPLAVSQPFLSAEGCELVMEVQQETNLQPALRLVVRNGQIITPSLEVRRFQEAADYNDHNGDDMGTVQRLRLAENIVLDPEYAAGEPTIRGRRLRVATIAEAIATGSEPAEVAKMWGIGLDVVKDAVRCSIVA